MKNYRRIGRQIRAARHLLSWTRPNLAYVSKVSVVSITGYEHGKVKPKPENLGKIMDALESAGIEFIDRPDAYGVIVRDE